MDINKDVKDLRELKMMLEELENEITAIEDRIKASMTESKVYEINGSDYKITWNEVTTSRIDTKALKAELPDIANRYTTAYTSRRFLVA